MRSIIQDGSDDRPPNEGEGAIHIVIGEIFWQEKETAVRGLR